NARHRVERVVQCGSEAFIFNTKRERKWLRGRKPCNDELHRLPVLIEIVFETPALETRSTVRENGDDVGRFDPYVALGRFSGQRARSWSGLGAWRRRRRESAWRCWRRSGHFLGRRRAWRRGRLWLRFDEERLPHVERQERQKNCE